LASVAPSTRTQPEEPRARYTLQQAVDDDPLGAVQPDAIAAWALLLVVSCAFWAGVAYVLWLFA
jgi:hypothetical protein